MPLNLKAINAELATRGFKATLAKGEGYFYFQTGEASDWLDRTVRVRTLHSLSFEQWIEEFQKLREQNRRLMQSVQKAAEKSAEPVPMAPPAKVGSASKRSRR